MSFHISTFSSKLVAITGENLTCLLAPLTSMKLIMVMQILFRMTLSQNLCLQTPCDFIMCNSGMGSLVVTPSPNKPKIK